VLGKAPVATTPVTEYITTPVVCSWKHCYLTYAMLETASVVQDPPLNVCTDLDTEVFKNTGSGHLFGTEVPPYPSRSALCYQKAQVCADGECVSGDSDPTQEYAMRGV
jgi:hypothetical protein